MNKEPLSIKKNMLWNSAGSLIYLGCQWLISVLVVRLSSGYDAAGQLALGMAVSNIFSPVGYYKIRSFQVSDVQRNYSLGDYVGLRVVTVLMSVAVMIAYAFLTCSQESLLVVYLYGFYSLVPIVVDVYQGEAQLRGRMDIIGKDLILRGFLSLVSFTVAMSFSGSLALSLIAMLITSVFAACFYTLPRVRGLGSHTAPRFSKDTVLTLLSKCFPAVLSLLLANAIPALSKQMLGAMYGTDALGVYASIAAPVAVVQMGVQYIYFPLIGSFAEKYFCFARREFVNLASKTLLAILLLIVVLASLLMVVGGPLLTLLYGSGLSGYLDLLFPLVVATSLTAMFWFLNDLLVAIRDLFGTLVVSLVAFLATIVSAWGMLGAFGLNGASFSVSVGFFAGLAVGVYRIAKKVNKIPTSEV